MKNCFEISISRHVHTCENLGDSSLSDLGMCVYLSIYIYVYCIIDFINIIYCCQCDHITCHRSYLHNITCAIHFCVSILFTCTNNLWEMDQAEQTRILYCAMLINQDWFDIPHRCVSIVRRYEVIDRFWIELYLHTGNKIFNRCTIWYSC